MSEQVETHRQQRLAITARFLVNTICRVDSMNNITVYENN
jgi:hypothetical protein